MKFTTVDLFYLAQLGSLDQEQSGGILPLKFRPISTNFDQFEAVALRIQIQIQIQMQIQIQTQTQTQIQTQIHCI